MHTSAKLLGAAIFLLALTGTGSGCGVCPRRAAVDDTDPLFARFEATRFKNECKQDSDCIVGGCGGEVCAAEPVISTCQVLPRKPAGSCGCVEGACSWFVHDCGESPHLQR